MLSALAIASLVPLDRELREARPPGQPVLTSAIEAFARVNQVPCFHRPLGTQKKVLLSNPNKTAHMQNRPRVGVPAHKNQTQRGFGPVSACASSINVNKRDRSTTSTNGAPLVRFVTTQIVGVCWMPTLCPRS
jgi:hypothetical protein